MDQFAIYFKAVCGGTMSGVLAFQRVGDGTRQALFTDGTYETHGTNVSDP